MNGPVNMLSAKKVKLHGMTSKRWTTGDKITQYKGLINLYKRDRKIIETDAIITRKRLAKELRNLQKEVDNDRNELDNAIRGDKQQLRNTLAEHKEMQLAHQNSQPIKVIESVHQTNFTKRKELDKLKYIMQQKSQTLVDLKLEKSVLEDTIKYEIFGHIKKIENEAQIITGKVQDAFLRKEAALAIKHTYAEIIAIMKKDGLYFDSILDSMENDGLNQSKCFLNATQLGQLATEYLDDRRQEYTTLEYIVIKDMKSRNVDLTVVQEQADDATTAIKLLIKKDSDINKCSLNIEDSKDLIMLRLDLQTIEETLKLLQTSTFVPAFEAIFPCLEQQAKQHTRLREMAKKCEQNKEIVLNKLNHAELMDSVLQNTMVENTGEYKQNKKALTLFIEQTSENIRKLNNLIRSRHTLMANVRIGLRQLQQICKQIKLPHENKQAKKPTSPVDDKPVVPEEEETNGLKMLPSLANKLTFLMSNAEDELDDSQLYEAYKSIEGMMKDRAVAAKAADTELDQDALLGGMFTEITNCLTRDDIKRMSDEIVAANIKNDDLVPMFVVAKKKFTFKK